VSFESGVNVMEAFNLLPDPQTNGGLLIAVEERAVEKVKEITGNAVVIGRLVPQQEKIIKVLP
jgi:selenide,water dikinase